MKNVLGLVFVFLCGCGGGSVVRTPTEVEFEASIAKKKQNLTAYKDATAKNIASVEAEIAHEERMLESLRERNRALQAKNRKE